MIQSEIALFFGVGDMLTKEAMSRMVLMLMRLLGLD